MRVGPALSALLAAALLLAPLHPAAAGGGVLLYVFGSRGCPHCGSMYGWLVEVYGRERVVFCELSDPLCAERFEALVELGVPPYVPTTVLVNGSVRAVVVGAVRDRAFVDSLLSAEPGPAVPLYLGRQLVGLLERGRVEEAVLAPPRRGGDPLPQRLLLTVSLAALDSVNPCAFALLLALLLPLAAAGGPALAARAAAAFVSAVFASYAALGLGLIGAARALPSWAAPALALAFGASTALSAALGRGRAPCPACRDLLSGLGRASHPVAWAAALGLASSATLLPCTAGPYLVFAGLASGLPLHEAAALLLLYNAVFVAPLAAVAAIAIRLARAPALAAALERRARAVRLASGLAVAALGLYLLLR